MCNLFKVHSYPRPSKLHLQSFYKPTLNQSKIYISTIKTRHHSDCDNLGGAHLRNIPNKTQFWSNLNPKYAWMCILIWQYWAKGYLFYQSECILTKRKKMWVCAYLITCSFNFFCRVSLNSFIKAFFMQLSGTSIDSNLFHI